MTNPTLKLGKRQSFFVKSRLKRLPQEDDTWEADFRALPKPMGQTATAYLGLVLVQPHGELLADIEIEGRPTVNDLARLLAEAMRRPMIEGAHRPRRLYLRGHPQWHELFPHLKEIGVEVAIKHDLPIVEEAYQEFLDQMRAARSRRKVKPTGKQASVEKAFPAIAKWVQGHGHIEIGDQEGFGFVVRALDSGGVIFEDDKPGTLAEAMVALENGLRKWFEEQGETSAG